MAAERVPDYADHPNYGVYPCDNNYHQQVHGEPLPGTQRHPQWDPRTECPNCKNVWWAVDGTECPEAYALIAEIETLRASLAQHRP